MGRSRSMCTAPARVVARRRSRPHDEPLVSERTPRAPCNPRREVLAGVAFGPETEVPAIAQYFAQPFRLAEPFTSRPGERTEYPAMLDDVEALVDRR